MERWHLEKTPASREWHLPGAFKGHRCQHVSTVKLMYKLRLLPEAVSSIVHQSFITCHFTRFGRITNSSGRWTVRSWKKGTCESMPNLFVGGSLMRQGEVGPNERAPLFLLCSYYFCWRYHNESNPLWLVKDFKSSSVRVQAQAQQHPPPLRRHVSGNAP